MKVAAAVAVVVVGAGVAHAAPAPGPGAAKKDRARAAKTHDHPPPPAPGTRPRPLINLYNQWTHEWLAVAADEPVPEDELDGFLRDHFTNHHTVMDARLVPLVLRAAAHFHRDIVDVVSGFRHPKYNLILRKKGHQVARDSQHTHGNAIDFFLPEIPTRTLHAWARAQHVGGVGLYLDSGFVHMDTGPIRYWSGD